MTEPAARRDGLGPGVTPGVVAGVAVLVMTVASPVAELSVYARLVVPGDPAGTLANLEARDGTLLAGILLYLLTFTCDLLVAWGYRTLLAPAAPAFSTLTAWLRLVYATVAIVALANLASVFRLVTGDGSEALAEGSALAAEVDLLLRGFRWEWSFGSLFFGAHLCLLGALVWRAAGFPRWAGALLLADGAGHLVYYLGPYLAPEADLRVALVTFVAEPVFAVWLLARARRIRPRGSRRL